MEIEQVIDATPTSNKIAFGLFLLAKLFGMAAVAFVVAGMNISSYICLGLDAVLLGLVVHLCVKEMNLQNQKDLQEEDLIKKMMKDGTLALRLKEIGYK